MTHSARDARQHEAAPLVFHASEFGARGDGVTDAGPAIRAAIAAAIATGEEAEVRLGRGRYRVASGHGNEAAIRIAGASKLVLTGEGDDTVIVVCNPMAGGIEVADSGDVLVQSLAVDYDPLPYTQGTVTEVNGAAGWFSFRVDAGYRQLDERNFHEAEARFGLLVRGAGGPEPRYGPHPLIDLTWERVSADEWRVKAPDRKMLLASGMRPGDRYAHMARRHSESAINFWRTETASVRDVTVYAGPSLASIWGQNGDVDIDGLRVEVLPGSNRLLSANGDGIHNLNTRGRLDIRNCAFSGMADDAINIHVRAGTVREVPAPNELLVHGGLFEARTGDKVQLYRPRTGCILAEATVLHAAARPDGLHAIRMDRDIAGLQAGIGLHDADHVYNLSACGRGFVVRGNRFGRHRGRGILVRSPDGTIVDNEFLNAEGWGIAVQHEPDWEEGPIARNLTITRNTFTGDDDNVMASVHIAAGTPAGISEANWGKPITGILIKDNRFVQPRRPLVHIQSAADVAVRHNVMIGALPEARFGVPAITTANAQGIDDGEAWRE
ncbi:right-handed parallel beta-helix repeat-containing protein [Cohnella rhizosphaerae]|uniref:Right-handed parallel beta-helix repeat-containing protein n=1 Tax=Cohnella rhizosphaerae TaxID=1457232 RepID=A0A9X4QW49_9BACL|nr:right-handed parallel beta-helix repeat-containing protein [Cohnella rhizosphaerae]MDG0813445.1 right-handed parallel beta-helix repeat-containing protein [Cohnella rhizosphaerae]